jgi:hypothetical protein
VKDRNNKEKEHLEDEIKVHNSYQTMMEKIKSENIEIKRSECKYQEIIGTLRDSLSLYLS